jgi:hypothetical protein
VEKRTEVKVAEGFQRVKNSLDSLLLREGYTDLEHLALSVAIVAVNDLTVLDFARIVQRLTVKEG